MGVSFYMDVHVPGPITQQLRLRDIDVLTAQDDRRDRATDEELLEWSATLGRLIFTKTFASASWPKTGSGKTASLPGCCLAHRSVAQSASKLMTWN